MDYYAGIDVSLEASSLCVEDASGKIVKETKVLSEPEDLIAWFKALRLALARIGPLSKAAGWISGLNLGIGPIVAQTWMPEAVAGRLAGHPHLMVRIALGGPLTAFLYDWNMLPIGQQLWLKELES